MHPVLILIGIILIATGGIVLWSISVLIGLLLFVFGICVLVFYFLTRPKYPVQTWIFLKRQGSMRVVFDKAARFKHADGTFFYKLKKMKDTAPAAQFENLYPSGRGEIMLMFSPAPGEYYPATFREKMKSIEVYVPVLNEKGEPILEDGIVKMQKVIKEVPAIQPIDDDLQQWLVLNQERARQKYMRQSAWDRYYPIFVVAVLAICLVIIIYGLFQGMNPVVDGFKQAANSLSAASQKNAEIIELLTQLLEDKQSVASGIDSLPAPPDIG